jgi:hypothetical protein
MFYEISSRQIYRWLQKEYPGYEWKAGDKVIRDEELKHLAVLRNGKLSIYNQRGADEQK